MSNCQFNPTPPYQIYFPNNELQDIQKICTKSEYSEYFQVYVFGSRLKKDCYNSDSDLDLMVKNINIDTRFKNDGFQHYMRRESLEKECNQVTFIKVGWSCIENIKPEVQKSVQENLIELSKCIGVL